jgi:hypothetical protein
MPDADIGANGALWVGLETTYGTPVDPSAAGVGVWVPILDENLEYTESKYYSNQIRQQATPSDVEQSFYHVAGNIHLECDANYLPYFLYASRHTVVKTGAGPYVYSATPAGKGATYPGGSGRGVSIVIQRNGVNFLYGGCVVDNWEFTLNNGILEMTLGMLGLSETDTAGAVTPSWIDASLFGAAAHSVYVDTAGLTPTFASRDVTYNGFTFRANHNGSAENRIQPTRAANYIKYGITEPEITTELDFLSKTEYNNFKAATLRSIRLESLKPGGAGGTFAAATEAVQITNYRSAYDTYGVSLRSMADLVAAQVTMKGLSIAGGSAYKIACKSAVNIT